MAQTTTLANDLNSWNPVTPSLNLPSHDMSLWGSGQPSVPLGANMNNGANLALPNAGTGTGSGGLLNSLQGWGNVLGGIGDIASAYMAYKNYGLAKDQYSFNKALTNRNIANQAVVTNEQLASKQRARGGVGFEGRVDGSQVTV